MENLPEIDFFSRDFPSLNGSPFFENQNTPTAEKFIVFFLNDELFGVSAARVAEVARPPALTALPRVPAWLLGIANLRGEIISVIDLSKLWNKPSSPYSPKSKLIVLRGNNSNASIAFTVDKLSEIITLTNDEIEFCDETSPHVYGKASHKTHVLNLLDTEKLASSLQP